MMFKREMAKLIFEGKKTATRRLSSHSSKVYREGSIQPIQINYFEKAKGHIKICKTYLQALDKMSDVDAKAEGFNNWFEFMGYLQKINKEVFPESLVVRVYEFELVKEAIQVDQ
jgi:hypothetical protein